MLLRAVLCLGLLLRLVEGFLLALARLLFCLLSRVTCESRSFYRRNVR